jgi:hypothetical protein
MSVIKSSHASTTSRGIVIYTKQNLINMKETSQMTIKKYLTEPIYKRDWSPIKKVKLNCNNITNLL